MLIFPENYADFIRIKKQEGSESNLLLIENPKEYSLMQLKVLTKAYH